MIYAGVKGDDKELNRLLGRLPGLMQSAAHEKGLRPAGKVVEKRLKELTPRSSVTGSAKKWSEKTKAKRAGELPLWKTTATKTWRAKTKGNAYAFIGYRWPKGNKAHFVVVSKGDTRRVIRWGHDTGQVKRKEYDILKQSLDDSRQQASAAFTAAVSKDVDKRLKELKRG